MNWQFRLPMLASVGVGLVLSIGASVCAEELEQHAAHEHGTITLNVVLEAQELSIELDAPAVNVVGFEHAPRTPAERAVANDAAILLKSGAGLFGMPPEARCRRTSAHVTPPHWEEDADDDDAHEHHADYAARFTFKCEAPRNLRWFEPWLLAKLRNVHEARVNVITASGQRSQRISGARERVALQADGT